MTYEPTHLDLFSGIGGFAIAAGWAGFRTIGFAEIDPYACEVLRKHWPNVPNVGDVRGLGGGGFHGVDLLTAGVPCQPASCAGQQRGSSDDRWLWPEALRILGAAKPTFAVFENPTGILALSDGMEFERLLSAMEGHGYAVQPIIVPACAVDAPHRRDRVWIVAHAQCAQRWPPDDSTGRASQGQDGEGQETSRTGECGQVLADSISKGLEGRQEQSARQERTSVKRGSDAMGDTNSTHRDQARWKAQGQIRYAGQPNSRLGGSEDIQHWPTEPDVGRVAHGVSRRVDRLKGLGNSIVPAVAYQILKAIRDQIA